MITTLLPAAVLVAITFFGIVGLRRFSDPVRVSFDIVLFVAISAYLATRGLYPVFTPASVSDGSEALWLRAIAGAWWFLGARIAVAFVNVASRGRHSREARLFSDLAAAAIYIATAAVVLNSVFALPVTGVVATSGVVALVLGLALQSTLADVFAGIAVGVEAPFSVGDRVQMGDGIEGTIVQLNWRSIHIQTDSEDIAIIPNSLVAKSEIINRSLPSARRAVSVAFSYASIASPDQIIAILVHSTLLCPAILQNPAPGAVMSEIGPKRNKYSISFFVRTSADMSPMKDMLLRAARRQLHYAGFLDTDVPEALMSTSARNARRLLRELVLFDCLEAEQLEGLADVMESRRLEPSEFLFTKGEIDASLYIVAYGVLEFRRERESVLEILGCIGAGEYVGEIGLLTGEPHAASAMARTHCEIYQLRHNAIAPLLRENAELAAAFERSVRRGLEIINRSVAARATQDIGAKGQLLFRIRKFFQNSSL